jgi:hypothetical protein
MTHGSLFDGAGGMRRGLEQAGFETKWTVDILHGRDITSIEPCELEPVDLISGGPVCRRTSRAAQWHRQRDNSSLWPYMLRIVQALRPKWVLVEQPASVARAVIRGWVCDLERSGYGVSGRIVDSKHWVPQQRARWYLIGRLGAIGVELRDHLYPDSIRMEGAHVQGSTGVRFDGNCPDCLRGGIFARVSARKSALMGAGNAVTVPTARWLGERIAAMERTGNALLA